MFGVGVVIVDAFVAGIERAEADDDDVDVRLAARFAFPRERSVGEVNLHPVAPEEQSPNDRHLFALGDGVGGD